MFLQSHFSGYFSFSRFSLLKQQQKPLGNVWKGRVRASGVQIGTSQLSLALAHFVKCHAVKMTSPSRATTRALRAHLNPASVFSEANVLSDKEQGLGEGKLICPTNQLCFKCSAGCEAGKAGFAL